MASTFARGIGGERLLSSLAAFSYSGASFLQCPHLRERVAVRMDAASQLREVHTSSLHSRVTWGDPPSQRCPQEDSVEA